jgi:excisionase family DNA binding protein
MKSEAMMADSPSDKSLTDVLTSRAAAQICGVNFRTVIRWIERGELNAYRLPGRGDYRISVGDLHAFMQKHGIPRGAIDGVKRVLVVDDDVAMAHAIERVLRRQGYEVRVATDGFEAGAMLHTFTPALMTLDLQMAGLDGFGVLRFLRRTNQLNTLKVLVISGESKSRLREALELGAHEVLAKPFSNEQLKAAVRRQIGESAAQIGGPSL